MSKSDSAASPSTSADAPPHERDGAKPHPNTPAPSRSGRTDDRRFGAKPTGTSSPFAIVRFGLTRAQRIKIASREERTMRILVASYDRATVNQICDLCDSFAASEGASWGGAA